MSFTADQYSQIASGYDKAADDPSIAPEKREEFTRKAEWFRFLAERNKGTLHPDANLSEGDRLETDSSFAASSPTPRRSLKPLLTMLWVTGAVVYLIGTVLFTNSVSNPFRSADKPRPAKTGLIAPPGASAKKEEETARLQPAVPPSSPASEKRHAISPDQPAYEAPGLIVPPSATDEDHKPASTVLTKQASAPPITSPAPEMLKVTGAATIRKGPSPDSKVIGTASPGAELQVKARENGWVQFVDPSSGNLGWIESHLLVAASPTGENSGAATSSAEAPSPNPDKPKPAKKRVKQKPSEPARVIKQRPSRPSPPVRDRDYADLPEDDEEFLAEMPPRPGFFARRRMLREGLMSPDFSPPQ